MAIGAAVCTIFTLFSILNTAGSAANVAYEKEVVGEALSDMKATVKQLRTEHTYDDPDKTDRRIKMRIADKLDNTAKYLAGDLYNDQWRSRDAVLFDTAKTTLTELAGRGAEDYLKTEVSKQVAKNVVKNVIVPLNIATGIVDNAIMAKSAWGADSGFEGKYFGQMARPSENLNLDMQIQQIKAQKLVKDTQKLNAELRQMMIDFGIDPDNPEGSTDQDQDNDAGRADTPDIDVVLDDEWGDDWGDDEWSDDYIMDYEWEDDDSYDEWDDGNVYVDDYYGTDEWGEISGGLGVYPETVDDYGEYEYDDTSFTDDDWDDGGVYPETSDVEFDYYPDDDYSDDYSGGGGMADSEPCDASQVLCGLDVAL